MPWMSTEMPPLTPTASCSGASTSAAAAVAVSVRLRKMARRSVSPTAVLASLIIIESAMATFLEVEHFHTVRGIVRLIR